MAVTPMVARDVSRTEPAGSICKPAAFNPWLRDRFARETVRYRPDKSESSDGTTHGMLPPQ